MGDGKIDRPCAVKALEMLRIDCEGLDDMDRKILLTIIEKYDGGPAGLGSIAAALGEDEDTLSDVYEPYLIQSGFIERTAQGRKAARRAYSHLGKKKDGELFEQ